MLRNRELDQARREIMDCDAGNQDLVALVNLAATLRTSTLLLLRAVDTILHLHKMAVDDTRRELQSVNAHLSDLSRKLQL